MGEIIVPDKIGYVTAYRTWVITKRGYLSSPHTMYTWPPREPFTAKCTLESHDAPAFSCTCGIYATKAISAILSGSQYRGVVALWGAIIEHEYGYRAQYAYPLALTINFDSDAAHETAKRYGIPVVVEETPLDPLPWIWRIKRRRSKV